MNFVELPDELILSVFKYLSVYDVANTRLACPRLNDLFKDEQLWKHYCMRDYAIPPSKVWYAWTYREFYSKVLHKFRYIFGWWKRDLVYYGGLLRVVVEPDGVFGYDCLPPLDDSFRNILHSDITILSPSAYNRENLHNLRYRRIFCLKPVGKQVVCFCYQSLLGYLDRIGHSPCPDASIDGHSCSELCHNEKMFVCKTENGFKFICHQPDRHDYNIDYLFETEHGFRPTSSRAIENILNNLYHNYGYDYRIKKFETLLKLCCYYDVVPLVLGEATIQPNALIKSGLYFGTYSMHGWEIINVHYTTDIVDGRQLLCGVKITGDPNIPAGQLSFRIFLNKPLLFSKSDQQTLSSVKLAITRNEKASFKETLETSVDRQYFATPTDCVEREGKDLPQSCISRYVAEGQIAGDDYTDPVFTPSVFSAFDENSFGLLWLDLRCMSAYYRANNMNDDVIAL